MNPTPIEKVDSTLAKEIQSALKVFGLYKGEIDGIPGKATAIAWKTWKERMFLSDPELVGTGSLGVMRQDLQKHPTPSDRATPATLSRGIAIPGISTPITASQAIYSGSKFTWGEATKNLERLPRRSQETENIVRMAKYMDTLRSFLGNKPITVTSWFRPEPFNRRVGGVANSLHITGLAVDFVVQGQTPSQTQKAIDAWHGDRGGLGYGRTFTHVDLRGFRARFNY